MNQDNQNKRDNDGLVELKLKIPKDLYRAYQRCTWIIIHETGREQLDVMEEMVLDFLVKNEC
ncbi:MAG: hypothetical protein JKY62_17145 [Desulfocapsa sp.]|jgi:hypothetical protein|uniref:Uncharacterized protein n=1 Tax=Desulfotalea psychrophila TaxID=84980 RepID=A0ABS3AXP0_9BACT|nr:hypothetical protein [Desulfocapsa sp.]MBN4060148.1 hypothetical protein [Desulfotalea psychrophila]MBN4068771.1 hypothetical protein [Desulfotalea psychrophila]